MTRRMLGWLTAALLLAAFAGGAVPAGAQAPVELTFYYPVAVGGPMTKIIDGLAADFEKENPGIQVKPIYAGTYQETIVKVLTALKSGEPPQMSVLLSTDMFTLIDEDAIVPFDDDGHERRGPGLAQELLPRLHAQQPDRRQDLGHPVPALHHRAVLEQGGLQGGRPRPEQAARHLGRAGRVRAEADQAGRGRKRHASGGSRCPRPASRTGSSRASRPRTTCS